MLNLGSPYNRKLNLTSMFLSPSFIYLTCLGPEATNSTNFFFMCLFFMYFAEQLFLANTISVRILLDGVRG